MAIDLTLKGTAITNREATPRVLNNPGLGSGARVKCARGYIASVTLNLTTTSIIRLVEIPSNCVVLDVIMYNGAETAGAVDVGLYRTNADGGAAVDQDFFASAVSLASAIAYGAVATHVLGESTTYTIAKMNQPIWQAVGASSDPHCMYDVACTVATTDFTTAAQPLGIEVWYVD